MNITKNGIGIIMWIWWWHGVSTNRPSLEYRVWYTGNQTCDSTSPKVGSNGSKWQCDPLQQVLPPYVHHLMRSVRHRHLELQVRNSTEKSTGNQETVGLIHVSPCMVFKTKPKPSTRMMGLSWSQGWSQGIGKYLSEVLIKYHLSSIVYLCLTKKEIEDNIFLSKKDIEDNSSMTLKS